QQLHLEEPPEIRVETPANSELFIITAEHSDPEAAAQASNKVAELLIAYHREFAAESTRQFQELLAAQLAQFGAELDELQQELSRTQGNVPTTTAMEQQRWSAYGRLWEQYDLARVREAFQASAI